MERGGVGWGEGWEDGWGEGWEEGWMDGERGCWVRRGEGGMEGGTEGWGEGRTQHRWGHHRPSAPPDPQLLSGPNIRRAQTPKRRSPSTRRTRQRRRSPEGPQRGPPPPQHPPTPPEGSLQPHLGVKPESTARPTSRRGFPLWGRGCPGRNKEIYRARCRCWGSPPEKWGARVTQRHLRGGDTP